MTSSYDIFATEAFQDGRTDDRNSAITLNFNSTEQQFIDPSNLTRLLHSTLVSVVQNFIYHEQYGLQAW